MNAAIATVFFNPAGFKRKNEVFLNTIKVWEKQGIPFFVLEISSDNFITSGDNCYHYKTDDQFWFLEFGINFLAKHFIPPEYDAIIYSDCDLIWEQNDWYDLTCKKLDDYYMVFPFGKCFWLDEFGKKTGPALSMGKWVDSPPPRAKSFHYGFSCAFRRDFFIESEGLFQWSIVGNNDVINCTHLTNMRDKYLWMEKTFKRLNTQDFIEKIHQWSSQIPKGINFSYVDSPVLHQYHGQVKNRQYESRKNLLRGYMPDRDILFKDNLPYLNKDTYPANKIDAMCSYFKKRKEDD